MLDEKEFIKMASILDKEDKLREEVIIQSRPIIKHSKKGINLIHDDNFKEAKKEINTAEKIIATLKKKIADKDPKTGSFNASLEEYAECVTFYHFAKDKKIPSAKNLNLNTITYLLGLCDLTGELARRAVYLTTKERYNEIKDIKDAVLMIYNGFLNFSLRNGELRKKYDSIKWNLKKIEEILYDLKIRDKI